MARASEFNRQPLAQQRAHRFRQVNITLRHETADLPQICVRHAEMNCRVGRRKPIGGQSGFVWHCVSIFRDRGVISTALLWRKRDTTPCRLMEADWLDRFRSLLPCCPTVLDIGCGIGEPMGRYLIEQGCSLTGVDSAPEMIAICETRLPQQTWRVGDMRSLSLDQVFNGILAWDSFFPPSATTSSAGCFPSSGRMRPRAPS